MTSEGVSPHVRRRTERDLGDCVRVLREVHDRDGYPVNWPDAPAEWLSPSSLFASWVAVSDGRIAGHVGLSRPGESDLAPGLFGVPVNTTVVVNRLFVAPWARGHGVGASLMGRVVTEARDRGVHPVLDVVASGTAAARLYEGLGWRFLGTGEQQWGPEQRVTIRCYAAPS
ncbi:acetyltransferase (GNAT) family protein [Stackebrandtia endophytica]|uniref:Acetyltransferase (GNAT) family protein n=1 Tax=Stackebrandtia endophytica TaxID=1496996 RepID=A0A543AXE6_9ACTN|nr:GNAT family N-acetyltransferase [Stackebrandtia endophytica]TQL77246.1 acetyltransferase (GNAT) family protein [Stackebrandtia endophytica]